MLVLSIWHYHLNVAADIENHQTRHCFSNLLLSSFAEPVWIVSSVSSSYLTAFAPVWSSAPVALLLQGLMCWAFRNALLQRSLLTIWDTVAFLSAYHSPLTPGINKAFSPTELPLSGYFLFFGPFSVTVVMVLCENLFLKILKYSDQHVWYKQLCHIRRLKKSPFFPMWCSVWTSADHLDLA